MELTQENLNKPFPRTRGGDPHDLRANLLRQVLFPAHAGVILRICLKVNTFASFPRTRGGDPYERQGLASDRDFSPHTRG